jgi:hypothetical protein
MGSSTITRAPPDGAAAISTLPPWASTRLRTTARPSPAPPVERLREAHARAQHLAQPSLQPVERRDDRADFRRAAVRLRQQWRIDGQIDAVDGGGGEPRQRPRFPLHDQERQQRHDGSKNAGAEADRQAERRDRQAAIGIDDQRFAGAQRNLILRRICRKPR